MVHQMAHENALWPGAIRLWPQWHKVKWTGIVNFASSTGNWWLQSIIMYYM